MSTTICLYVILIHLNLHDCMLTCHPYTVRHTWTSALGLYFVIHPLCVFYPVFHLLRFVLPLLLIFVLSFFLFCFSSCSPSRSSPNICSFLLVLSVLYYFSSFFVVVVFLFPSFWFQQLTVIYTSFISNDQSNISITNRHSIICQQPLECLLATNSENSACCLLCRYLCCHFHRHLCRPQPHILSVVFYGFGS